MKLFEGLCWKAVIMKLLRRIAGKVVMKLFRKICWKGGYETVSKDLLERWL